MALIVLLGSYYFRSGSVAEVVITRKARFGSQMRLRGPEPIVTVQCRNGTGEPGPVFGGTIYREQHLREKRRLRAGQVIGSIRIQYPAIEHDFIQEVIGDTFR